MATLSVACAARQPRSVADRFVTQGEPTIDLGGPVAEPPAAEYVATLRALSANARPRAKTTTPETLEGSDAQLRGALAVLAVARSAAAHRDVAVEYRRLGIMDAAYTHLSAAIRLHPGDATAFDLRARLWRSWGLPGLGIADARRAVALAPQSATAWNTLGLLLENRGSGRVAIRAYVRAVQLDRRAGYAWNNLCRAWTYVGEAAAAADACRRTIALDSSLTDAPVLLAVAERMASRRPAPPPASDRRAAVVGPAR